MPVGKTRGYYDSVVVVGEPGSSMTRPLIRLLARLGTGEPGVELAADTVLKGLGMKVSSRRGGVVGSSIDRIRILGVVFGAG